MPPLMNALLSGNAVLLFMNVFAEQLGAPLPSYPLLVASGATAGTSARLVEFLILATVACVLADLIWYWAGMHHGTRIMDWLARFTFLHGHKASQQNRFTGQGAHWLLVSKFLPGMGALATLMAGIHRMSLAQFLLYDTLGSLLWSGSALVLGRLFEAPVLKLMEGAQDYLIIGGVMIAGVVVLALLVRQLVRIRAARSVAGCQPYQPADIPAHPATHNVARHYPKAMTGAPYWESSNTSYSPRSVTCLAAARKVRSEPAWKPHAHSQEQDFTTCMLKKVS